MSEKFKHAKLIINAAVHSLSLVKSRCPTWSDRAGLGIYNVMMHFNNSVPLSLYYALTYECEILRKRNYNLKA